MNLSFYQDYFWKNGLPHGLYQTDSQELTPVSFKIVSDPYRKRITLEKYIKGKFSTLIYDTYLLDFRKLNPMEQNAWQKEIIEESPEKITTLIRNGDDRVILVEKHTFDGQKCRKCLMFSPHGILLSIQRMYYTSLQDSFSGVILYDPLEHPVLRKSYACTPEGEFTDLLEENWMMGSN